MFLNVIAVGLCEVHVSHYLFHVFFVFLIVLPEQVMIGELFNYLFVYIVVIIYCVSVDHF